MCATFGLIIDNCPSFTTWVILGEFGFNKSYSIFLNSKIITFVQGKQQISKKLKDYLKKNLEYYKIPQKIIKVKKFLLNKNGKIDTDYLKKKIRNEE